MHGGDQSERPTPKDHLISPAKLLSFPQVAPSWIVSSALESHMAARRSRVDLTTTTSIEPLYFPTQSSFRKWLEKHHNAASELWVGYFKTHSGAESITWPQSVDEALCFGWIDGVRKSIDGNRYMIRFSPRKRNSIWSAVNIRRAKELQRRGLMTKSGIEAFNGRDERRAQRYSFEQKHVALSPAYNRKMRANKRAWAFFQSLPPSTQKPSMWWVMSAKKEETQRRRLDTLITSSAKKELIPPLRLLKKPR